MPFNSTPGEKEAGAGKPKVSSYLSSLHQQPQILLLWLKYNHLILNGSILCASKVS